MVARAKTDSTITTDEKIYNKASLCAVGQQTRSPNLGPCDRNADCPGSAGKNRISRMGDVRNVFDKANILIKSRTNTQKYTILKK